MLNIKKGFSLIELLVVIAIIGILAAGGGVYYSQARKQSRDLKRQSDLAAIQSAIELYYSDEKKYPADLPTLVNQDYLSKLPEDPSNDPAKGFKYIYKAPPAAADPQCQDIYALYTKAEVTKNSTTEICNPAGVGYIVLTGGK